MKLVSAGHGVLLFFWICIVAQLTSISSLSNSSKSIPVLYTLLSTSGVIGHRQLLKRVVRRENDLYAPRDRYPYVVSLQHPLNGQHFCVGTLIHKNWILTYARCIDTNRFTTAVKYPVAALGSENLAGVFKEKHLIKISFVHPLYNGSDVGPYDVALLRLSKPSTLQPLVELHHGSPPLLPGLETRALSWSRLEAGGPYSKRLLEIRGLQLLESSKCKMNHGYSKQISCLKVSQGTVCSGGTGGPIIFPSFPDRLIGMALESEECEGNEKISWFVPIEPSREWIWNVTAEYQS